MEDYYTIQTPGHHSTMFTELHVLQKQGVMCDVILAAEDGEVMAHKVVLMAASKYFRDKLSPVMGPVASKICLRGISVVELANLVKYIYTGKLLVAKETMDITLEISEILELQGVIQGYKEIISYEQMKESTGDGAVLKSDVLSVSTSSASGFNSRETSAPQSSKAAEQVSIGQPVVSNVSRFSTTTLGTQPVSTTVTAMSSSSASPLKDFNKCSKVVVVEKSEHGSAASNNVESSGDAQSVNTASDFNFDSLYDQQYMDVSAGSKTPSKNAGINSPQTVITPPKLKQMAPAQTDSQKMAEERAQHQDLLTVAIETLSDVPHLKQQPYVTQPEIDRAVSSISGSETIQMLQQNTIGVKPEQENLEEFENGKTNTKTVTMSAGSVNNELGGKTDVYTVALDPATVSSPIKMPRPKKTKTAKEKEAEEKAKKYRQKKAELLASSTSGLREITLTETELRRGKRQKSSTSQQDFQYESLSKTKKKTAMPKILLISKSSDLDDFDYGDSDTNTAVTPKVIRIKIPKEEKNDDAADDFGQVVNFDNEVDVEDDVDGIIANDLVAAFVKGDDRSGRTENSIEMVDGEELELEKIEKVINKIEKKMKTKISNRVTYGAKTISKKNDINAPTENVRKVDSSEELDEVNELDVLHVQNIDEATAEKIRSSSTKRKTRTPRKLPLSDEDRGSESGPERHDNIPVVRTRQRSRSLNLDKEIQSNKPENAVKIDLANKDEAKDKKKSLECKGKDLSKPTEIRIVAQSKIDEKALDAAVKHIHNSESKKIIIVPKNLQPEIRLKKRTTEEMLQMAKDIPSTLRRVPSNETKLEKRMGEEEDDDRMSAGDKNKLLKNSEYGNKEKTTSRLLEKRKIEASVQSPTEKKRKIGFENICTTQVLQKDQDNNTINKDVENITGNTKEVKSNNEKSALKMRHLNMTSSKSGTNNTHEIQEKGTEKNKEIGKAAVGNASKEEKPDGSENPTGASSENASECMESDVSEEDKDSKTFECAEEDCLFSSRSAASLRCHQTVFHHSSVSDAEEEAVSGSEATRSAKIGSDCPECFDCGKTFKTAKNLKKHLEYCHSDMKKLACGHCDFETQFKSSMNTHLKLKHSQKKEMYYCKYCCYGTQLDGNLRKHMFSSHGLIIVTKQHKKSREFEQFEEGTIVTKEGVIFDPETMELPKQSQRKSSTAKRESWENVEKTRTRTKISLSKLPVEDFLKEMMKRHEDYMNEPEKKYSFMSSNIARATEHPSFPQASPQVRNTRANKIYNMKKIKPTYTDPNASQSSSSYGLGDVHGLYHGAATVPQVASEVEVEHDNEPEVVLENVESDPPTTVLTISEQKGIDGAEMIVINQNGKQTVVRSKDFYDTLQATGNNTSQTLGVISALLQAGEQIEIREQEEMVEIQNI